MPIYDANNNVITLRVQQAVSRPDVVEVKNRTLDGKYHIQTIGEGATMVEVVAHFTTSEKVIFDTIKKTGASIKVTFEGNYYIGLIDGELQWQRIPNWDDPIFIAQFTILVNEEGVL